MDILEKHENFRKDGRLMKKWRQKIRYIVMVSSLSLFLNTMAIGAPASPGYANLFSGPVAGFDTSSDTNTNETNNANVDAGQLTSTENVWKYVASNCDLNHYENNPRVLKEVLELLKDKSSLESTLADGTPYIYYIYTQIKNNKLPAEFALLPFIESSYNPRVTSRVGAAGLWQLMPGTASGYGVTMDWWFDARRDLSTSTTAALTLIRELYQQYNNWEITLAAYNAGSGTVAVATKFNKRIGKDTDYWSLPLPKETQNYVPKLYALAIVIKHHKKYGIKLPYAPAAPYFSIVTLASQLDLSDLSKLSGLPVDQIKKYNMGFSRYAPDPKRNYTVILPVANAKQLQTNLAMLSGQSHRSWQYHEVSRNETLTTIAERYSTNGETLKEVNHLKSHAVSAGQGLLVPAASDVQYKEVVSLATPVLPLTHWQQMRNTLAMAQPVSIQNVTSVEMLSGSSIRPAVAVATSDDKNNEDAIPEAEPVRATQPIYKSDNLKTMLNKIYGS